LTNKRLDGCTALFLVSTIATSVTGFLFPVQQLLPSHVVGIISLALLAVAVVARFPLRLIGIWRRIYVFTAVLALYLNFFVLIVQSFLKVPALHTEAPTQSELPFVIAQLVALTLFGVLAVVAAIKFRGGPVPTA
jgi:hypothetical protein